MPAHKIFVFWATLLFGCIQEDKIDGDIKQV